MPSDIEVYLSQIRKAIYGRDVRNAIAEGIKQCYKDTSTAANDARAVSNALSNNAQDIVIVQQNQPTNKPYNKVWVKPQVDEVEVPTYTEFSALNAAVTPRLSSGRCHIARGTGANGDPTPIPEIAYEGLVLGDSTGGANGYMFVDDYGHILGGLPRNTGLVRFDKDLTYPPGIFPRSDYMSYDVLMFWDAENQQIKFEYGYDHGWDTDVRPNYYLFGYYTWNSGRGVLFDAKAKQLPVITEQPVARTAKAGALAVMTSDGLNYDTVLWYYSTDNGQSFSPVTPEMNFVGYRQFRMLVPTTLEMNGWRFKACYTNSDGSVWTGYGLLTVTSA